MDPQDRKGYGASQALPEPLNSRLNGIGFSFLNSFDPYATYAANSVVSYVGSSYVAIVPNGPNPNGPAPDTNPSWSLMAKAGSTGAESRTSRPSRTNRTSRHQGLMGESGP